MNNSNPTPTSSPTFVDRHNSTVGIARVFILLLTGLLFLGRTAQGALVTWDASGANPAAPTDGAGNWGSTATKWSNGASDNGWVAGDSAIIGAANGAAGTITITNVTGVIVSNITYNGAGSGSYNINSSGGALVFTGNPTVTVASGVTATNTLILGGTSFTKAGSGTLVLIPPANNTNVGPTIINGGTVNLAATSDGRVQLNGNVVVNSGGVLNFVSASPISTGSTLTINGGAVTNGAASGKTITLDRMTVDNNGVLGASNSGATLVFTNFDARSGLLAYPRIASSANPTNFTVKSTAGTVIVQGGTGSSSGVQGLLVTLNGGTLLLDYLNPGLYGDSAVRGRLINTTTLTLGGGTLFLRSQGGSGRTEVVAATSLNAGANLLLATNTGTASGISLTMNGITRAVGSTIDGGTGTPNGGTASASFTTTNVNNAGGILGGWATWNASDWARGTTLAAIAAGAYQANTTPANWGANSNVTLNASTASNVGDGTNINSLRLTAASTVTLDGTLTITSGGLLVTGNGATAITGGTLKGASGADLIVHQYATADLTISSTLADNGAATSLTKSGTGKLIITGTDNLTGANYLNGGTVEVSDLAKLAGGRLIMNNGALRYTGTDASSSRSIILNGVGGIFDVAGGTKLTQAAPIKGNGGYNSPFTGVNLGDWGGITKIGGGTLTLAANNVYNGPTIVSNGVVLVNGTNSLSGVSGTTNYLGGGVFTVFGGTLGGTGLISGPVTVKIGGTISPGTSVGTLTLATNLILESGSTNLFEIANSPGASDLLVVNGNLTIQTNSTISISALGSPLVVGTYTLIQYTGTKTGSFKSTPIIVGGSIGASFAIDDSTPGQINLVVSPQVVITSQPADAVASTNDPVTFTVTATGLPLITYQWYRYADGIGSSPVAQPDATNAFFTIASAQGSDSGYYGVVITNDSSSVTSRVASLFVGNISPVITGPTNKTVIAGNNVTFNTTVTIANPAPAFQWQTNGVDVAGATSSSLTLNSVSYGLDGTIISVIATNVAGMVTNSATLTVIVTPVITPQPTNLVLNAGSAAVFTSGATGVPTPTLQWYKNGAAISGETGGTLTIASAQGSDIGTYSLVASNAAGSATSSNVKLTVISTTLASTAFSPANGATGVCYDTPLYATFDGAISIVNSGKIRIYNVTNSVTPVDTIDMSSNTVVVSSGINLTNNIQPHSLFPGDSQVINYFPVIITGNTAAIYPHGGVMTSNQTYYVTLDNGIVKDSSGAYFAGISDTNAWQFTTKLTGPASPTNLLVAADGTGDFVTVQGAVDSILPGNNIYTVVNVNNGNYVEIVNISGKSNVTFRGQSRTGTIVGYPNNNNLTGTTAGRMAFKVNASDVTIENLTLTNGTPQGGSQAETLLIYNSGLRCVVNNCDIVSRQDTILINAGTSQGYFYNCKVVGNFDYVWGQGVGYFDNCVFHTLTNTLSGSYNLTAARTITSGALSAATPWVNPNGTTYSACGFSFVNCVFEADAGVTGITLAGSNGTVGGLDSWVNCLLDTNAYVTPTTVLSNSYVFWQNNNKDITGANAISFANIQTIGVPSNDPRLLAATNVVTWFSGWLPPLPVNTAPVFTAPPAGTNIAINVGVNLAVTCTATDSDTPAQTLTYSLPTGPSGAAINPSSGVFTWRPTVAQENSANPVSVVASDNGTPNLSATNNFTVTVNPLTQPSMDSSSHAGGQFSMTVSGQVGPDYTVQVSTNLATGGWSSILTTNPVAMPFSFTDTNGAVPVQFFRILVGP